MAITAISSSSLSFQSPSTTPFLIPTPKRSLLSFPRLPPPKPLRLRNLSTPSVSLFPPPPLSAVSSAASSFLFSFLRGRQEIAAPLGAVASAAARWLGIYAQVLHVWILLTWFPNIPWNRQPFSALGDLCLPFLALFRKILPPVMGKIDVSPILAVTAVATLASLLSTSPAAGY